MVHGVPENHGLRLVSVIVLNWNGSRYLNQCLDSVLAQSYPSVETILVDNASSDGSWETALSRYAGRIQFLRHGRNVGFAEGMNSGFSRAAGDYLIPLNLDVFLRRDFIENCVQEMERFPEAGIIGGKECLWAGGELTSRIVSQGGFFLKRRIQGITNVRSGDGPCFGAHGSFPFLRREALEDVFQVSGYYYDPKYGTGWEDMDLWFRMHLLGFQCRFLDRAVAWHVGSSSADGNPSFLTKNIDYQRRIIRNRYYLIWKNLTPSLALRLAPSILLGEIAILPYLALLSPRSLVARFLAVLDFMKNHAAVRHDRRRIQGSRKASSRELRRFFIRF